MPIKPQDLAELQSAALVLAHVAHFSSEPEGAILGALDVDPDAWDQLRDSALDKLADDVDAGLAFSRVFTRTKAELATRSPSLSDLLAARRPAEAPSAAPPEAPKPLEPPTVQRAEPEAPREPPRAPELPSFARVSTTPTPAQQPAFEAPAAQAPLPPPLVRPALPAALSGKETGALDPEMIRRAALPFAGKGPPALQAEPRVVVRGGRPPGSPGAEHAPGSQPASDGDTLPAGAGATPGAGPPTALTLRQYAELHAALSRGEASRAALLLRAGLDEASFSREDAAQRHRLAHDPIAMAQFKAMFSARGGRT